MNQQATMLTPAPRTDAEHIAHLQAEVARLRIERNEERRRAHSFKVLWGEAMADLNLALERLNQLGAKP